MYRTFLLIVLGLFFMRSASAHPAYGIVVDARGNIYFTDIAHGGMGTLWMLSTDGELRPLLSNFHAHNVDIDGAGNLYTAHGEGDHSMLRIQRSGKIDTLLTTTKISRFFGGNCTYSPNEGMLFGHRQRIWRAKAKGSPELAHPHTFEWNQNILAGDGGVLYATDIGSGNGRVIKLCPDGTSEVLADDLFSGLDRKHDPHADVLLGLELDGEGNLYVSETGTRQILQIGTDKEVRSFYRSSGPWCPSGVFFWQKDAYILEFNTQDMKVGPQITRLNRSGETDPIFNFSKHKP